MKYINRSHINQKAAVSKAAAELGTRAAATILEAYDLLGKQATIEFLRMSLAEIEAMPDA